MGGSSRIGEQLELWSSRDMGEIVVPWEGRSPRELTRVVMSGIFKAQAGKSMSDFVSSVQCDLWLAAKKGPPVYRGAPLLVELPRRDHG